jgi:hypothetical protein
MLIERLAQVGFLARTVQRFRVVLLNKNSLIFYINKSGCLGCCARLEGRATGKNEWKKHWPRRDSAISIFGFRNFSRAREFVMCRFLTDGE